MSSASLLMDASFRCECLPLCPAVHAPRCPRIFLTVVALNLRWHQVRVLISCFIYWLACCTRRGTVDTFFLSRFERPACCRSACVFNFCRLLTCRRSTGPRAPSVSCSSSSTSASHSSLPSTWLLAPPTVAERKSFHLQFIRFVKITSFKPYVSLACASPKYQSGRVTFANFISCLIALNSAQCFPQWHSGHG